MANSTTSCVTMFAFSNNQILKHKDEDRTTMIINVSISTGFVASTNFVGDILPLICQSFRKEFKYPRKDFVSGEKAVCIISKIIQDLEIQFPLENINWGLNFPANPKPENLNEIISARLSKITRDCAAERDDQKGPCMELYIRKLEKVSPEKCQQLLHDKIAENNQQQEHEPLRNWRLENQNDDNFGWCLLFICKLALESPEKNKYFGVRSVTVKEDDNPFFGLFDEEEIMCCSICIRELKKGKQAIRMPCSHIFHGFCIFRWLSEKPTCPICRFELFNSTQKARILSA